MCAIQLMRNTMKEIQLLKIPYIVVVFRLSETEYNLGNLEKSCGSQLASDSPWKYRELENNNNINN